MSKQKIPLRQKTEGVHHGRVAVLAAKRIRVSEPKALPDKVKKVEAVPVVKLAKRVLVSTIQTSEITIEVEGGDDRAQTLADNLTEQFVKALPKMVEAFGFGRVAAELWDKTSDDGRTNLLGGVDTLSFKRTEMVIEKGEFAGIKFKAGTEPVTIPPEWSWWCAIDATAEEPHGRSRYDDAVMEAWKAWAENKKRRKLYNDRFANGWGFGKAPSQYPKEVLEALGPEGQTYPDGKPINPITDMKMGVEGMRDGDVLVVDSATDANGNPLYEFAPPQSRQDSSTLETERQACNDDLLRALGFPERSVTQNTEVGSNSMAQTHADPKDSLCEDILSQICASYQEQVIDRFVKLNYKHGQVKLTIKFEPLADPTRGLIIELLKGIVEQPTPSPLVTHDIVDIAKMMEVAGVPAGIDVEDKLKAIRAQAAMQMIGAAPLGGPETPPAIEAEDEETVEAPGGETVEAGAVSDTALNGAQIASMLEIMAQLSMKAMSPETSLQLLKLAFPTIDVAEIARLVKSTVKYTPPPGTVQASRRLSAAPEPPDWEAISARLKKDAKDVLAGVKRSLADPKSIDRRLLQRGGQGIRAPDRTGAARRKTRRSAAAVPTKAKGRKPKA
jgi:hypothetical protein